jgi:alpha-galactosidase
LEAALAAAADALADAGGVGGLRPLGPGWCSWYAHWDQVSETDVLVELAAIDRLGLGVAVVQIDDGHQAEIGDWLARSPRFGPLEPLATRIRDTGREAGLWTAPFLVGARSRLAAAHPDWLVGGATALRNWGQDIGALDVTHPDAAEHLAEVYRTLRTEGFTYHKLDFCYAGAMDGRRHADATGLDAYAEGLRIVRDALGPDATLLGCGAPLLPSVGWVDAMRVSPDIAPRFEPEDGDLSQPAQRSAVAAGRARRWMHGRWWVNDPDCLIVRPEVEHRDAWARHVARSGGLAVSSDPLGALDDAGFEWTRALLRPAQPEPLPDAVADLSAGGPPADERAS